MQAGKTISRGQLTPNHPVVATRLTPQSLQLLILEHVEPLDLHELWTTVTHVVFEGFKLSDDNVVLGD